MDRRDFLRFAGLLLGATALPARTLARAREYWQNWTGNQTAQPLAMHFPLDEDELAHVLRKARGTVRFFGASHSFNALVPTDDTMVSLEALAGPQDGRTLTFSGGTRIGQAARLAWEQGKSLTNQPDIDLQSLAGALATSTHGTGVELPSISGLVESLRLMTVQGETLDLDENDGDLFRAALCSLGALGAVTRVRLKGTPRYRLRETSTVLSLKDAMDQLEREKDRIRHIEMYAFPEGGTAILKRMVVTDDEQEILPADDGTSDLLEMVCELTMRAGWLTGTIQKRLGWAIGETVRQGPAFRVFANTRNVRFNEMEYMVPAERGMECLEELCAAARRSGHGIFFPLEYRCTAADDSLIGMFSHRASASIAVHSYYKERDKEYFAELETIFQRYEGRPHWGKVHTMTAGGLSELYPGFDRFRAIRRELDPEGRLLNPHVRRVLGEVA